MSQQNRTQKYGVSFIEGMDKDSSFNKYQNKNYYHAENLRFITDQEGSTGMLINDVGDVKKLIQEKVNDTEQRIAGWAVLRSDLFLFILQKREGITRTKLVRIPKSSIEKEGIIRLEGNWSADAPYDIIFYDKNFRNDFDTPIKAIARRESENVDKIYWLDGVSMKYCIIRKGRESEIGVMDRKDFEVFPFVNLRTPFIEGITGGNIPASRVQYAYQLYNVRGNISPISGFSNMYNMAQSTSTDITNFTGSEPGENTYKGCRVRVGGINTRAFNRIRLFRIQYTSFDLHPEVFVVADQSVTDSTMIIEDVTAIGLRSSTIEEILIGRLELLPETFDSKNNILFVGNVEEKSFAGEDLNYEIEIGDIEEKEVRGEWHIPNLLELRRIYNSVKVETQGGWHIPNILEMRRIYNTTKPETQVEWYIPNLLELRRIYNTI